jgi:peptidyl-prolyl cis-trans isomerase D
MAALQTLRNKPALLMSVIGGALLLFIITLTDLNSCSRPNVEGEVNGEELTYEDLEKQVRDEENLESLLLGSVEDSEKDNIRRNVWNDFVQQQAIATEAGKLGIVATKEDIQNELSGVTPQQLQQVAQMLQYGQGLNNVSYAQKIMLLMARYMGQPGVEAYKQFMKTVDQQIAQLQKQDPKSAEMLANLKQACLYCESRIPEEIVTNKYMGLIAQGATSNPISSKMDYEENTTTVGMEVVNVPYSTVADKDITITDSDLKAKYSACKEFFRTQGNTRDLKFIHVTVAASSSDRDNILAQVKSVEDSLRKASTAEEVEAIMRGAKSDVNFMNVYIPKSAYTESQMNDVVNAIDSLTVGGVLRTKLEAAGRDGVQYISTYKMVGTKTTPDSMQICQFAVDSKEAADSIVAAVKAGSTLSAEAAKRPALTQKYGLKGDTAWNATKY